jgi:hypothetical protein
MTEPKCVRCGGTDDLMDRGMAPGMTYCAPCRTSIAGFAHCLACMTRWSYKTNDSPDHCPECGEPGVIPEEGDSANTVYVTHTGDGHVLFECPGSDSYPIIGKLDG